MCSHRFGLYLSEVFTIIKKQSYLAAIFILTLVIGWGDYAIASDTADEKLVKVLNGKFSNPPNATADLSGKKIGDSIFTVLDWQHCYGLITVDLSNNLLRGDGVVQRGEAKYKYIEKLVLCKNPLIDFSFLGLFFKAVAELNLSLIIQTEDEIRWNTWPHFTDLLNLNLTGCGLNDQQLSVFISRLPNTLKYLNLSDNRLEGGVPYEGQLSVLHLNLRGNPLKLIDPFVKACPPLQTLTMRIDEGSCKLETWLAISELQNLVFLDLSGSDFTKLPSVNFMPVSLRNLSLNNANIWQDQVYNLGTQLRLRCKHFQVLSLDNTKTIYLPDLVGNHPSLCNIRILKENVFPVVEKLVKGDQKTQVSFPHGDAIFRVLLGHRYNEDIQHLVLKESPLTGRGYDDFAERGSLPQYLRRLSLIGSQLESFGLLSFVFKNLVSFEMRDNHQAHTIDWGSFPAMANLEELRLPGSLMIDDGLGALVRALEKSPRLRILDISGNHLKGESYGTGYQLLTVKTLNISGNPLVRLDSFVYFFPDITSLEARAIPANEDTWVRLFSFSQLLELNLSGNDLKVSPGEKFPVEKFPANLRNLNVSGANISGDASKFVEALRSCPHLESLNLEGNYVLQTFAKIKELASLKVVQYAGRNILDMEEEKSPLQLRDECESGDLFLVRCLYEEKTGRQLLVSKRNIVGEWNPQLEGAPAKAGEIRTLVLDSNPLRKIQFLGIFEALEQLSLSYLSGNSLPDLSPLSFLTNLTELLLIGNNLTMAEVPVLTSLERLSLLDLSHNNFEGVDALPTRLPRNLLTLKLTNNKMRDMTPLTSMTSLTTLFLQGNQLQGLPSLNDMGALDRLDLSDNPHVGTKIDVNVSNTLKTLHLKNVVAFGRVLDKVSGVQILDLESVKLQGLGRLEKKLPGLRRLSVKGNNISLNPRFDLLSKAQFLTFIDLSNCSMTCKVLKGFVSIAKELQGLTGLNLDDNPLEDAKALESMTQLQVLQLSRTGIKSATCLSKLTNLQQLSIAGNGLTELHWVKGLNNLVRLDLSDNKIPSTQTSGFPFLQRLKALTHLDVSRNPIQNIETIVRSLLLLKTLDISDTNIEHFVSTDVYKGINVKYAKKEN